MSYDTSYMKEECAATLQYLPFQLCLIFHSATAILSFYATSHFLHKHMKNSPIHNNFKFLLLLYFFVSYLRGAVFLASTISFLYRVFILDESNNEEKLLMNPMTFKIIHLSFALLLIMDTTVKALLVFERTIATGKVETYETEKSKKSCWIYIAIIILFPASIVFATYRNAEFSQSVCFALFAPRNTEIWINMLYLAIFLFALLSFILLRLLIFLNNKKLKFHNFKLTTRYQIRENLTCTYLISSVLLTGLAVYC
ncbi:unnamed protein product [Caenorhabditis nigoni]